MQTNLFLRCKIHIHTDFGRYIETPVTVVYFHYIHISRHFAVACTQLYTGIRLELAFGSHVVTKSRTERQLENHHRNETGVKEGPYHAETKPKASL